MREPVKAYCRSLRKSLSLSIYILCIVLVTKDAAANGSAADDDNKPSSRPSPLTSSLSTGASSSTMTTRPVNGPTARDTAAAAGGSGRHGDDDVIRQRSTDAAKHQRSSSLDNARPTDVSWTCRVTFKTIELSRLTVCGARARVPNNIRFPSLIV